MFEIDAWHFLAFHTAMRVVYCSWPTNWFKWKVSERESLSSIFRGIRNTIYYIQNIQLWNNIYVFFLQLNNLKKKNTGRNKKLSHSQSGSCLTSWTSGLMGVLIVGISPFTRRTHNLGPMFNTSTLPTVTDTEAEE